MIVPGPAWTSSLLECRAVAGDCSKNSPAAKWAESSSSTRFRNSALSPQMRWMYSFRSWDDESSTAAEKMASTSVTVNVMPSAGWNWELSGRTTYYSVRHLRVGWLTAFVRLCQGVIQ